MVAIRRHERSRARLAEAAAQVRSGLMVAVSAMALASLSGVLDQQSGRVLSFAVLLLVGALRVWWMVPAQR